MKTHLQNIKINITRGIVMTRCALCNELHLLLNERVQELRVNSFFGIFFQVIKNRLGRKQLDGEAVKMEFF